MTASLTFFESLRRKVDSHFTTNKIHRAGNAPLYTKSVILILTSIALYVILVFITPAAWIAVLLCILLGINIALIGFNIMHEGGHQSFSRHSWINNVSAHFLNVLGGNAHFWRVKHNLNHHTHTNIEGMDSDIDAKPFLRLHDGQPLRSYHRYQHLYFVALYGISYLAWIFYEDFVKYFRGSIALINGPMNFTRWQHFTFWMSKILFVLAYIVIPVIAVGFLPWTIGFTIVTMVVGVVTTTVFQLAHVVPGTEFFESNTQLRKQDWAIDQIRTTANFATDNVVLHWMLGGLNFQIEHHLFPRISHIHYPMLRKLVRETCVEYGITYNESKSMFGAIASHVAHLRKLGRYSRSNAQL